MALPLLAILQGASAGGAALGAGIQAARDPYRRFNRDQILRLETHPGLTDPEKHAMQRAALVPLAQQQDASFNNYARAAAAGDGMSGGASMAQLRGARDRTLAAGSISNAANIEAADLQQRRADLAELDQRKDIQSQIQQKNIKTVANAIGGGLKGLGKQAGATPEFTRAAGMGGAPAVDPAAFGRALAASGKFTPEQIAALQSQDSAAIAKAFGTSYQGGPK